jgi:ABC-type multidrug transport system ATPase subunit
MHFLPDVYVTCDVCKGKRYNRETLDVLFKGKTIADVLDMTVEEAADFFKAVPPIRDKMETLKRVGLSYIKVGQQATTLSGGEAQRVKLSKELSKRATGRTLYILDEPTTGLHFEDTKKLLEVLHELVDQGNTVVVIEHNLDVVKTADWLLDFGPEGGDGGGEIVAVGSPQDVAKVEASWTGRYLKDVLARHEERRLARVAELKKAKRAYSCSRGLPPAGAVGRAVRLAQRLVDGRSRREDDQADQQRHRRGDHRLDHAQRGQIGLQRRAVGVHHPAAGANVAGQHRGGRRLMTISSRKTITHITTARK